MKLVVAVMVLVAVVAVPAGPASASTAACPGAAIYCPHPYLWVNPNEVAPGGTVGLVLYDCPPDQTARATSNVFIAPAALIYRGRGAGSMPYYTGSARISANAKLGNATVRAFCAGSRTPTQTTTLRIVPQPLRAVPSSGRPGQKVTVQVTCDVEPSGGVKSSALTVGALTSAASGQYTASGTVNANARPGSYAVSTTCAGKKLAGSFTVLSPNQVPQKPKGPAQTGGG
ncbi:hypothetical protein ACFQ1S_18770, partial [Kibdelosporangium lantanae]